MLLGGKGGGGEGDCREEEGLWSQTGRSMGTSPIFDSWLTVVRESKIMTLENLLQGGRGCREGVLLGECGLRTSKGISFKETLLGRYESVDEGGSGVLIFLGGVMTGGNFCNCRKFREGLKKEQNSDRVYVLLDSRFTNTNFGGKNWTQILHMGGDCFVC